jgi:hypothetical protein
MHTTPQKKILPAAPGYIFIIHPKKQMRQSKTKKEPANSIGSQVPL